MNLYDMLDKTKFYQEVSIYLCNIYDQNIPLFEGSVNGARADTDIWDYLMCEVERYCYCNGTLVIYVKNENYRERIETGYDKERENRSWLYSAEIEIPLPSHSRRKKNETT